MGTVLWNYKSILNPPIHAPNLEDLIDELYINTVTCFGDEEMDESDYVVRLVDYLHNDLEHMSSPVRKKSCKVQNVTFRGLQFKVKKCGMLHALQNRWELFVLMTKDTHKIAASCLVHFNDIYGSCEIHEVCAGIPGKGYCKELLKEVRNHISHGQSGPMSEIRIFCEGANVGACKCYSSVFPKARLFERNMVTGFVYAVPANRSKTSSLGGRKKPL